MVKKGAERRTEDGKRWAPELTLIYISILILMGHALTMVVICTLIHLLSLISHFSLNHSFILPAQQTAKLHPSISVVCAGIAGEFSLLLWRKIFSSSSSYAAAALGKSCVECVARKVEGGDERMCGMKSKKTTFTQKFKNVWVKNSLHFLLSLSFQMLVHSLNLDLLRVHIKWTFSPFPSLNSCSFR